MKNNFLLLYFLLIQLLVVAQEKHFDKSYFEPYKAQYITRGNFYQITDAVETSRGIHIFTNSGIFYYHKTDGRISYTYNRNSLKLLSEFNDTLFVIQEYSNTIYKIEPIDRSYPAEFRVIDINQKFDFEFNFLNDLRVGKNNTIWLSSYGEGIYKITGNNVVAYESNNGLPNNFIRGLDLMNNEIPVALVYGGLTRFLNGVWHYEPFNTNAFYNYQVTDYEYIYGKDFVLAEGIVYQNNGGNWIKIPCSEYIDELADEGSTLIANTKNGKFVLLANHNWFTPATTQNATNQYDFFKPLENGKNIYKLKYQQQVFLTQGGDSTEILGFCDFSALNNHLLINEDGNLVIDQGFGLGIISSKGFQSVPSSIGLYAGGLKSHGLFQKGNTTFSLFSNNTSYWYPGFSMVVSSVNYANFKYYSSKENWHYKPYFLTVNPKGEIFEVHNDTLYKVENKKWNYYAKLGIENYQVGFFKAHKNSLFLGVDSAGVIEVENGVVKWYFQTDSVGFASCKFISSFTDRAGRFNIITDKGIYFKQKDSWLQNIEFKGFEEGVKSVYLDPDGVYWISYFDRILVKNNISNFITIDLPTPYWFWGSTEEAYEYYYETFDLEMIWQQGMGLWITTPFGLHLFREDKYLDEVRVVETYYKNQITLFPNPAQNNLNIILPHMLIGEAQLNIHDLKGNLVFGKTLQISDFNQSLLNLNITSIPSGNYIISVHRKNRLMAQRKLIITKP